MVNSDQLKRMTDWLNTETYQLSLVAILLEELTSRSKVYEEFPSIQMKNRGTQSSVAITRLPFRTAKHDARTEVGSNYLV